MLDEARLRNRLDELRGLGLDVDWVDWFGDWLRGAPPERLTRIRPSELAEELGADLHHFLKLLVAAVRTGILNLHWEHFCPACQGRMDTSHSLGETREEHYCGFCENNFQSVLDQNVAISFSLNESMATGKLPEAPRKVKLDEADTRAVELFTLQAFREMFPDEVLPIDESLQVTDVSLMFTDVRGSTRLYERLGDSRAYHLVRDHFKVLFRVVEEHRGAVVKTIGDSVMASFRDPVDALKGAVSAQGNLALFNRQQKLNEDDVIIRIGMDRGPAIAVNLNDRLDFFGNTVNRTARIERLSAGNDVVFGANLQSDPRVQEFLVKRGRRLAIERFERTVKGIEEPITAFRLTAPREVELFPSPRRAAPRGETAAD